MKLTCGFSPCPNDTFIFEALLNRKIKSNLDLTPVIEDVEGLNLLAFHNELDITKLSFNAYAKVSANYQVISSGGAMGTNCGPLVVMKKGYTWNDIERLSIAIPGIHTTANLLLTLFAPGATNKKVMLFSEIEDAVANGQADAGLIIHESRFTFESKGLKKLADMGELWEQYTGCPLPLGCIAVKRSLDDKVKREIEDVIRESVKYALQNPESSREMVGKYAAEMSEEVQRRHIALYVNEYSIDLGAAGKNAVDLLFRKGHEMNILPSVHQPVFI